MYSVYSIAALRTFPLRDLVVAGYIKMPPYFRVLCMSATMEPTYRAPRGALPSYSEERSFITPSEWHNWIYRLQSIMGGFMLLVSWIVINTAQEQSPNTSEIPYRESESPCWNSLWVIVSWTSVDIAVLKLRLQCKANAIKTMGNSADIIRLLITVWKDVCNASPDRCDAVQEQLQPSLS